MMQSMIKSFNSSYNNVYVYMILAFWALLSKGTHPPCCIRATSLLLISHEVQQNYKRKKGNTFHLSEKKKRKINLSGYPLPVLYNRYTGIPVILRGLPVSYRYYVQYSMTGRVSIDPDRYQISDIRRYPDNNIIYRYISGYIMQI